jgi:hypothetical protein
MFLTNQHDEALKSIGFDLTEERYVIEYFDVVRNESDFFKKVEDVVTATKSKSEIIQKVMAWAVKDGLAKASVAVCDFFIKVATERKDAAIKDAKARVDSDLIKAQNQLAYFTREIERLTALKNQG